MDAAVLHVRFLNFSNKYSIAQIKHTWEDEPKNIPSQYIIADGKVRCCDFGSKKKVSEYDFNAADFECLNGNLCDHGFSVRLSEDHKRFDTGWSGEVRINEILCLQFAFKCNVKLDYIIII